MTWEMRCRNVDVLAELVILIVQPTYHCFVFISESPWLAFHSLTNISITQFSTSDVGNWRAFTDTWHHEGTILLSRAQLHSTGRAGSHSY